MPLAVGADDRDLVLVAADSRSGRQDVVEHQEVHVLRDPLGARPRDVGPGLGRERDAEQSGTRSGREHVDGPHQIERERLALSALDRSPEADGAAALVLADVETALTMERTVAFRAREHVQDFLPMSRRDIVKFEGCRVAWQRALDEAKLSLDDLSFVETHDCFTIAELIEYEAMGLTDAGQGAIAIEEGWTEMDGKLPVNASGGLKSKGHPVGATGVSMHVLSALQLAGEAGDFQVPNAELGGIYNMGGTAVANYVSILERIK